MKKIFLLILFLPFAASAAGVEVTPARLEIQAETGKQMQEKITVSNPTVDVLLFDIYPDDFKDIISISPASFTLESGERKTVALSIAATKKERVITTYISVLAKPLADSRFSANTGVKIPLSISVSESAKKPLPAWTFPAYVLIILLVTITWYLRKKNEAPTG